MDEETKQRLDEQDKALKEIYISVEKTRKYFLWTMISTIVMFVLPLIGIALVIPIFLKTYNETLNGLNF